MFFICLVFIIAFNAKDFINLRNGVNGYIQNPSGMLGTTLFLMGIPMLVFDLTGIAMLWTIIISEVLYITFYTWMYFKIKEERKNNKK